MDFPKINFADEDACFKRLYDWIHRQGETSTPAYPAEPGSCCPRCGERSKIQVKQNHRQAWRVRYCCSACRKTFNAWTGTPLRGTHRAPSEILRIFKGVHEGQSDLQLGQELGRDRGSLAHFRRHIQTLVVTLFGPPSHQKKRHKYG